MLQSLSGGVQILDVESGIDAPLSILDGGLVYWMYCFNIWASRAHSMGFF